jgi:hypothetical protein
MAIVKMNDVGTKKAMLVYALFNGKCANFESCNTKLAFTEYQIDHITPRDAFLTQGKAIDHKLYNLAPLCKACNSSKQNKGIEFYSDKVQSFLNSINVWTSKASNPNDIRTILKREHKGFFGGKVNKQVMDMLCDSYAKANPTSKFARIHKQGKFHKASL